MLLVAARKIPSGLETKYWSTVSGLMLLMGCVLLTSSCSLPAQSASVAATSSNSKIRMFRGRPGRGFGGGRVSVSASFPQGTVGTAYNVVVSVSGGTSPYQFSITSGSLPIGLSLNAATGTVSGTPVTAGSFKFTIGVIDSSGAGNEKRFTVSIAAAAAVPAVSIQVSPVNSIVVSGATQQFAATVSNTSNPGVAWRTTAGKISSSGSFTAPQVRATSAATVTATSVADPTKTASATVSVTPSTIVAVPPPSYSGFDGPAELPRVYIQSAMADTPAPGNTVTVHAGDNLQNALNAANCGDTILLQAAATFSGFFTLPAKPCDDSHWVIVRTSAPDSSLPAEGTRLTPCYAGVTSLPGRPALNCSMRQNVVARIVVPGTGTGPLAFEAGANHYRFIGLEITRPVGGGVVYSLVSLKPGATADHIVLDRMWLHGTPQDDTNKGVQLGGSTQLAIVDSFFTDFHCTSISGACTDASTVGGGAGDNPMGPYKIVNNFLEASGENVLFGGAEATLTPADIEVRHNHMFKPLIWKQGQPGFVGGYDGNPFVVKNLFELKNAQRVLLEGNILENTWGGFSQAGYGILLTPKNQSGPNGTNLCPLCQVTDVTIRYSTISHVAGGLQIANGLSDNGGIALDGERYSIHDITIDDIDGSKYNGPGEFAEILEALGAPLLQNVSINHVTGLAAHSLFGIGDNVASPKLANFTLTNNVVSAGTYPVWSTGGGTANCAYWDKPVTTLAACFTSSVFSNNAIIATPANFPALTWPAGNFFPADATAMQFVNYNNGNGGDYHLSASSAYKNAATDGKDLGADIDAINAAISGAK
jgi:putative Ig domain-containing protein